MSTMQKILLISYLFILIFLFPSPTFAITDPLSVPNNKFGIHILSEHDFEKAAELVNSSGGDWGYITFVIRRDEIHQKRWQDAFDRLRELHLIPIVRVANTQKEGMWEKPVHEDIDDWVSFFNSLNWVTTNRYIIIGNEPNHAKEWGGSIDPAGYAEYLLEFSRQLKASNKDYFVLPAGLDASAPNGADTMDIEDFLHKMAESKKEVFDAIDGWNSHSYPNPGFSGPVEDMGRVSIRSFQWELTVLSKLGIAKSYPIFITETGWIVSDNQSEQAIAENYTKAFQTAWNDSHIVAITPFILNYTSEPFSEFSWLREDRTPRLFYDITRNLSKINGIPSQETSGDLKAIFVPPIVEVTDTKIGVAVAKNTGQSIWYKDETSYIEKDDTVIEITSPIFSNIKPNHSGLVYYRTYKNEAKDLNLALKLNQVTLFFPINFL